MPTQRRRKSDQPKTWWQGNSTRVWRLFIVTFLGVVGVVGTYMFTETTSSYKVFATKIEVHDLREEVITKFDRVIDKIDEINRYLRDMAG